MGTQPLRHVRIGLVGLTVLVMSIAVQLGERAQTATITASYDRGYTDVILNDYGATGMGSFRLADGGNEYLAFCLEAHHPHTEVADAYSQQPTTVASQQLDALLFSVAQMEPLSNDDAIAAAALTWLYAGAQRTIGPPVWSNPAAGFAAVSPGNPYRFDRLPPYSAGFPVGLLSSGQHLDQAERRIQQLHDLVQSRVGKWELVPIDDSGFRLVSSRGPISDWPVTLTVEPASGAAATTEARTNADGIVTIPALPNARGATVTASTLSPGPHQEWDGAGDVQRLATPTSLKVSATVTIAASVGYLQIQKLSADKTISPAGAKFKIVDSNNALVANVSTDENGNSEVITLDPTKAPLPYTIVETQAPAGLTLNSDPVTVTELSSDVKAPTTVAITNLAGTVNVRVQKVLDQPVGPEDFSGFEFSIVRTSDDLSFDVTTGPSGVATADVPLGEYTVCEKNKPTWAASTTDTGCRQLSIGNDQLKRDAPIIVEYVNTAPLPRIGTAARDGADGDKSISPNGGLALDRVNLAGLVPGTPYTVAGQLAHAETGEPIGTATTYEFVATTEQAEVELEFAVPALPAGDIVIVERLWVGDTLLAEHVDLTDESQTLTVRGRTTTTTTTSTTPASTTSTTSTTVAPTTSTSTTVAATPVTTSGAPTTLANFASSSPTTTTVAARRLPATGAGDSLRWLLRAADIGFVIGVALLCVAGWSQRRQPAVVLK